MEMEQRVNHKRTIKEGAVPADPAYYFSWCIHYLRHLDANTKCYSVRHVSMAYQDTHPHHDGCSRWLNTRFRIESIEDEAWPDSPQNTNTTEKTHVWAH